MELYKITIDGDENPFLKTGPFMLSDLEFAYNPIEQKVRDLQEYL
jgi:hypothetical protein